MSFSRIRLLLLNLTAFLLAGCGGFNRDLQPEEIWSRVSPSVVRIESKSLEGDIVEGSGFVCEFQGKKFIVSNRHVVLGAKEVRVGNSKEKLVLAPRYRISPELDLALIDLPAELRIPPLRTRKGGLKIGERVFAIGFPLGLNKSITEGLVSSETEKLVQFDASIASGSSGGPLVDKDGVALGVVTAGSTSSGDEIAQNLNFAIKTAFIPRAELFKDPIIRFYDAWRELVKLENKLIDGLQDLRVSDVQIWSLFDVGNVAVVAGLGDHLANLEKLEPEERELLASIFYASHADQWANVIEGQGSLEARQKALVAQLQDRAMSEHGDSLARIIRRHGSLEEGKAAVVAFLRAQTTEFDKIPELFVGLGADGLVRNFCSDERKRPIWNWNIQPSEIPSLLKTSVEFTKADYEELASRIEFSSRVVGQFRKGSTNIISLLHEFDPKRSQPPRRMVHPAARQQFLESGGMEGWITSMFSRMAIVQAERGDFKSAIGTLMNEIELRRYPNLQMLGTFRACEGDVEKAYALYSQAHVADADRIDPFTLQRVTAFELSAIFATIESFTSGRQLRYLNLDAWDEIEHSMLPEPVRRNLAAWGKYLSAKPALALTRVSLTEAINSPVFQGLSEFEKCWVLDAQKQKAIKDDRLSRFQEVVRRNADALKVYQKCFQEYFDRELKPDQTRRSPGTNPNEQNASPPTNSPMAVGVTSAPPQVVREATQSPSTEVRSDVSNIPLLTATQTVTVAAAPRFPTNPAALQFKRYSYTLSAPARGNRDEALSKFNEALALQRAGDLNAAIVAYRAAIQKDPGFFEAHYNLGVATYESGQISSALTAYETALALKPDSRDARYNFALALRAADYPLDAAEEIKKLIASNANEARLHFSLGNLYAQQLGQLPLARHHYERALALDPNHPQAAMLRAWLAANPE